MCMFRESAEKWAVRLAALKSAALVHAAHAVGVHNAWRRSESLVTFSRLALSRVPVSRTFTHTFVLAVRDYAYQIYFAAW